jgi:hypothetical protein
MAAEAKKHYAAQMDRYQKSLPGPASESEESSLIVVTPLEEKSRESVEAPLPPNALTPYPDNIFGLDKARRDCRFEMIKIVKEVRNSLCP